MYKLLTILLLTFGFAETINVPGDYSTIQNAIDAANDGDEIVVAGGTYFENLFIEKGITLRSADPEDPAIIDGSQAAGGTNGSCIIVRTPDEANQRISPTIEDLELTGGLGSEIIEDSNQNGIFDEEDSTKTKIVGGGLLIINSSVTSRNNKIRNNGVSPNNNQGLSSTHGGGGGYVGASGIDLIDNNPDRPPRNFNTRAMISFSGTRFINNSSYIGRTVMSSGIDLIDNNPDRPDRTVDIDFSGAEFDVAFVDEDNPENSGVSEYWVVGDGESSFDFTGITAETDAVITDVWVNPDPEIGVDEGNINGSIDEPFLTIDYALSMIYPTAENPISIHLVTGTYSPSTNGANFPLIMSSNTTLRGQGVELTILDAEQTGKVLLMDNLENTFIEQLTLMGGVSAFSIPHHGAGIYLANSTGIGFDYLTVRDNAAVGTNSYNSNSFVNGMGVYVEDSDFTISNTKVLNNYDTDPGYYERHGGGMYIKNSPFTMRNVFFRENFVARGGGLFITSTENALIENTVFYGNGAGQGAGLNIEDSDIIMDNVHVRNNGQFSPGGIGHTFAYHYSAGIYASGGNIIIKNSHISENFAYANSGIHFESGTLLLQNTLISENRNLGSGDAYADGSISISETEYNLEASALIVNCTFANNTTRNEIGLGTSADMKIVNSILQGGTGGEIAIRPSFDSDDCDSYDGLEIYNSNLGTDLTWQGTPPNASWDICNYYDEYNENFVNQGVITVDPLFINADVDVPAPCTYCGPTYPPFNTHVYFPNEDPGNYGLQNNSESINSGTSSISQFSYDGMLLEDISNYSGSAPDMGYIETCETGEPDLCGVCGGDNSTCSDCNGIIGGDAYIDDCATCDANPDNDCVIDECNTLGGAGGPCLGDNNNDGLINIMDLIVIIELILCGDLDYYSNGEWDAGLDHCSEYFITQSVYIESDYNQDGQVTIGDVVAIIENEIYNQLGRSIVSVDEINIYKSDEGLYIESTGFVALDITLSHEGNFNYSITKDAFINRDIAFEDITRMIIVDPESNLLFTTENLFEIEKIMAVTVGGKSVKVNMVDSMEIPGEFSLSNAYPNPFNPSTTMEYYLPNNTEISIVIYDLQGRQIASLINDVVSAGNHSIVWNANNYSSGIYFVKMVAGNFIETQKLVMVK